MTYDSVEWDNKSPPCEPISGIDQYFPGLADHRSDLILLLGMNSELNAAGNLTETVMPPNG